MLHLNNRQFEMLVLHRCMKAHLCGIAAVDGRSQLHGCHIRRCALLSNLGLESHAHPAPAERRQRQRLPSSQCLPDFRPLQRRHHLNGASKAGITSSDSNNM